MNETNIADENIIHLSYIHKAVAICMYSTLSIIAVCGNSLIVLVILHFRRLRTATNILILNLAVADLMISTLCMPFSYWHVIIFNDQRWIFGPIFCKLFAFLQATAVFLSSWTLVAISFDRFTAILFVLNPRMRITRKRSMVLVLITWSFSVIMAAPLFYVNQMKRTMQVDTCEEYGWKHLEDVFGDGIMHSYGTLVFSLQYCLPLTVLVITYTAIGIKMWNSQVPGATSGSTRGVVSCRHESVKKMIRMVLLVSALYAGCWLPQNLLINILLPYDPSIASDPRILYFWWMANTIAMLHSIVNPFVYYSRNARFREGFRYFLKFLPCVRFDGLDALNDRKSAKTVRIMNLVSYMPVSGMNSIANTSANMNKDI